MHHAALGHAENTMEWLKGQGADISAQNHSGQTPMHEAAAAWGKVGAIIWLKAQGIDISARDNGLNPT